MDHASGISTEYYKKHTEQYKKEDLIGMQIMAVVNFPPRQVADFMSEVLVLGTYSDGGVVLITPQKKIANGDKLG